MLNVLERLYHAQKNSNYATGQVSLLDKFSRLLEENFAVQKPVAFYAEQLCVTPHYLNGILKKTTGKAVSGVMHDRLMLETKRLLLHTDLPIGQIADQLGFNDFSYFSRQFKKHNGLSPERYRAGMHDWER